MSVLRRRLASGLVYGLISLLGVYLGGVPFLGVVLLASLLAGHEYQRMVTHAGHRSFHALQLGLTTFLVLGAAWLPPDVILGGFALIFVSSLAWQLTRAGEGDQPFLDWSLSLAGSVYVGGLFAYFVKLRALPDGLGWMILALAATWSCDSLAYVFGKAWGRRSFFPSVSPKKTWEGALAGLVGGTVVVVLIGGLLGSPGIWCVGLGLAASLAVICGDLVESMIKRQMGVKDSGGLVPGHGGILDRVDSLLLAVIFTYYYVTLVPGG